MKFVPKKSKYKKQQRGSIPCRISNPYNIDSLYSKTLVIRSVKFGELNSKQLDAFRQSISKRVKRVGRLTIEVFPSISVSSKPLEVRMGKGKGNIDYYICKVKAGAVIAKLNTSKINLAVKAIKSASIRLPFGVAITGIA